MSYTYKFPQPSITGDVIVYDKQTNRILLIKRKSEPFKDCWAIVGGFFNSETNGENVMDLSIRDAAIRELKEEVNISYEDKPETYVLERWCKAKSAPREQTYSHDFTFDKKFSAKDDIKEYIRTLPKEAGGNVYHYVPRVERAELELKFLTVQDAPHRDPRGRVATLVYVLTINGGRHNLDVKAQDDASEFRWVPVEDILSKKVPLAFDHLDSIEKFYMGVTYV